MEPVDPVDPSPDQKTVGGFKAHRPSRDEVLHGSVLLTWDGNWQTGETTYSAQWTEMLGYAVDELAPDIKTWESRIHPEDRPKVFEALHAHLSGAQAMYECEYRLRHRDGRWIWILARGKVYERAADGSPLRIAGIHQDISKRREAEEALLLSREMYKNTVELSTQIPWVTNPDGTTIERDPLWADYTGENVRVPAGMDWLEAFHPDDRERTAASWTHAIATGEPLRVIHRLRHRDGEYRYCQSRAQPQRDEKGVIVRWYGATEDIHERVVAEQALIESERHMALAVEGAGLSTWDWNLRSGDVIRDPRWARMLGYDDGVTHHKAFWEEHTHPEDWPTVVATWEAHCKNETHPFRVEYRMRHQSGEWRWILTHGRIVERDALGPVRACGINQDVTKRREQEREERTAIERDRLEAVVQNLHEGVIIAAPDGTILLMNRVAKRMYGFDSGDPGPLHADDLFRAVDASDSFDHGLPKAQRPLARAIRGEAFSNVETHKRNAHTNEMWIGSCGSTPVRAASGELISAVLTVRDVTAERRAAQELSRANEILHELSGQLLRLQDEERRRIARELHDGSVQVLAAALMNLAMLKESPSMRNLDAERRLLARTASLTEQCVKELRTMSYLLHPPVLDELGLGPALRSWIDGFSERSGIPVEIAIPEDLGRLSPEAETALFRITQEALGNVHRHAESSTAGVRLDISMGTIELEITDDGKGFDPALSGKKGGHRKLGVGLLGMRERAGQVGGSLTIESRPGRTAIRVSLPRIPRV